MSDELRPEAGEGSVAERLARGEVVHVQEIVAPILPPPDSEVSDFVLGSRTKNGHAYYAERGMAEVENDPSITEIDDGTEAEINRLRAPRGWTYEQYDKTAVFFGARAHMHMLHRRKAIIDAIDVAQTPAQVMTLMEEGVSWNKEQPVATTVKTTPQSREATQRRLFRSIGNNVTRIASQIDDPQTLMQVAGSLIRTTQEVTHTSNRDVLLAPVFEYGDDHPEFSDFMVAMVAVDAHTMSLDHLLTNVRTGKEASAHAFTAIVGGLQEEGELATDTQFTRSLDIGRVAEKSTNVAKRLISQLAEPPLVNALRAAARERAKRDRRVHQGQWTMDDIVHVANVLAPHMELPKLEVGIQTFPAAVGYILEGVRRSGKEVKEQHYETLPFLTACSEVILARHASRPANVGDLVVRLVEMGMPEGDIATYVRNRLGQFATRTVDPEYDENRRRAGSSHAFFYIKTPGKGFMS